MAIDFVIKTINRERILEYCKCTHIRRDHGNLELGCLHCACLAFDLSSMSNSTDKEIASAIAGLS